MSKCTLDGRLCQLAGPRPLRQFCLAVEVAEPLGGAHIAGVPGAVGPAVEADDGQVVPGGGQHGGEPGNGRGVDDHGGQAEIPPGGRASAGDRLLPTTWASAAQRIPGCSRGVRPSGPARRGWSAEARTMAGTGTAPPRGGLLRPTGAGRPGTAPTLPPARREADDGHRRGAFRPHQASVAGGYLATARPGRRGARSASRKPLCQSKTRPARARAHERASSRVGGR